MELRKALCVMKQSSGWEKFIERSEQVVSLSLEYSQGTQITWIMWYIDDIIVCREHCCSITNISSARLSLQGILTAIKKVWSLWSHESYVILVFQNYIDPVPDDMIKLMKSLEEELEQINNCILQLRANNWLL